MTRRSFSEWGLGTKKQGDAHGVGTHFTRPTSFSVWISSLMTLACAGEQRIGGLCVGAPNVEMWKGSVFAGVRRSSKLRAKAST